MFLRGLYCSIKYFIWNKKLSFIKWFHVIMLLSCFFEQFFVPRVDINRGEGVVEVQFATVKSALSVAQWVWRAPLYVQSTDFTISQNKSSFSKIIFLKFYLRKITTESKKAIGDCQDVLHKQKGSCWTSIEKSRWCDVFFLVLYILK